MLQSGVTDGVRRRVLTSTEVLMTVSMAHPTIDTNSLLSGAQFADAFSISTKTTDLTARDAATRMFSRSPRWVDALLRLWEAAETQNDIASLNQAFTNL